MLQAKCPDCSKVYEVSEELAGKAAKCRECGGRIPIPKLRENTDLAANRTKAAEPKPASAKPASTISANSSSLRTAKELPTKPSPSKAAPTPATKSKPTAKPKQETTDDDLFEDDLEVIEEIEDYDDLEEVADADDVEYDERTTTAPSRTRKKKTAGKNKKSGPSSASAALSFFAGSFVWWAFLAGVLTCAGFAWSFFSDPLGSKPLAQTVALVGLPLLFASAIWMIVVTFRVSSGWGVAFIIAWLTNLGLNVAGHRAIAGGVSLLFCAVSLILVIQYWKEFRAVFLFQFVLGMFLVTPLAAVLGMHRMMQDHEARIPTAGPAAGESPKPDALFNVASIPIPRFKELNLRVIQGHENDLIMADRAGLQAQIPGVLTILNYWQPVGRHANRSLGCVLVASAGSTLLHGATVPDVTYVAETRPYVDAGFAVLGVSLDGPILDRDRATDRDFVRAYEQFRRAGAGTVNVRNAVEFLTNNVPQVDPQRIYIAGHSSAATLALLAAEHEPRLKGCIAYAPATDVVARLNDVISNPAASRALPGVADFAKQSSPLTHVSKIGCPVFLFHAADDSNVPVSDSRRFADLLKANGKAVTYVEVPTGDHYDSMIQKGIPTAIPWLKQLAGESAAAQVPTVQVTPTNPVNSAVPKGAELPAFPNGNLPQPSNVARSPSGRVVTFRFQSFGGSGDSTSAARQALKGVAWADLNDVEIDPAKGEIRIGQVGGSVNSEPARQALIAAGFQLLPGVSIGNKSSNAVAGTAPNTTSQPNKEEVKTPPVTTSNTPAKSPPSNTPSAKPTLSDTPPAASPSAKARESQTPRRIVKFRYQRYSGKGSSEKAVRDALKRFEWANQEDIVLDTKNHEIRIGLLAESSDFEPARKALTNAGFVLAAGITTATVKD